MRRPHGDDNDKHTTNINNTATSDNHTDNRNDNGTDNGDVKVNVGDNDSLAKTAEALNA